MIESRVLVIGAGTLSGRWTPAPVGLPVSPVRRRPEARRLPRWPTRTLARAGFSARRPVVTAAV